MKDHYFLSIRRRVVIRSLIHKGECPFLHEASEKIFLGTHNSPGEAIRAAGRHYRVIDRCAFCMKEGDQPENGVTTPGSLLVRKFISAAQVETTWESAFVMSKS